MAYHGYIPYIKSFLSKIESPSVLEIGLDVGMTTIPITTFMSRVSKNFQFCGIDVLVKDQLKIILSNIDRSPGQVIKIFEENSLKILPALFEAGEKFDVILIDGDHNYYTVCQELSYLNLISKENSLVIVDDYHGRWAERDLWYSERDGYERSDATQKVNTDKQGVKTAVDEFLSKEKEWELFCPIKGEPVILKRTRRTEA